MTAKSSNSRKKQLALFDRNLWYCFLLCFFIAFLCFIAFIIAGKGAFALRDDFNTQQLTFLNQVNGFIKQQDPGEWCWNLDIGASFINGFAFYVLGSPFSWIFYLFQRSQLPYVIGWIYMLKYAVAGATAYMFLKCRTGKGSWQEICGAILYAFSGFSASALEFYHFHDVVAFFPLMLIGIEKMIKEDDTVFFTAAVFINCLTNYYFFIGECFFCILYFVFRHIEYRKRFFKDMWKCLLCGVLGVCLAGILFTPSIVYILANPRTSSHLSWKSDLLPSLKDVLYFSKGILLPGEAMNNQSAIFNAEWNSTAGWLPMCGLSLCIAYVLKKRDELSLFIVFMAAVAFSPFLSSGFSMFTRNYQRWWFMLVLICSLASVKVLNDIREYPVKAGIILNAAILLLYYGLVRYLDKKGSRGELIWHPRRFLFLVLVSLFGLLVLYFATNHAAKLRGALLVISISVFAGAMTIFTIYVYRIDSESTESILNKYALSKELSVIDEQYRYELENNANLITLTGDIGGVGAFTSTSSNYRFELNKMFDHDSSVFALRKDRNPGLSALFGAKFVLTQEPAEGAVLYDRIEVNGKTWFVTEQPACPIGYAVDSYILMDDLMEMDLSERGIALLYAVAIEEKDESAVRPYLKRVSKEDIDTKEDTSSIITRNEDRKVGSFKRDSHGLTCTSEYDRDSVVFFSVPNDPGWVVQIDGQDTDTINSSGGLISIIVPAGSHSISFVYHTPGFRAGTIMSIISAIIFIVHICICFYKSRKRICV